MKVIQRYEVNGHYLKQTVDGLDGLHEIKEYGWGKQSGKFGPYGNVLYPYGTDRKPQVLPVIKLDGKWVRQEGE